MNIGAAFTRKLGPLPVWAWAGVVGAGGLAFKVLRGGQGNSSSQTPVQQIPVATTDLPDSSNASFLNELSARLQRMQDQLTDLAQKVKPAPKPAPKPPPTGGTKPAPIGAKPPSGIPLNWPAYARASLTAAKTYARHIIRNYSPGGTFYHRGVRIPKIPVTILPLAEQQALARQYHGTLS